MLLRATENAVTGYIWPVVRYLSTPAVEYCAPAWCRSAHSRHIDLVINDALRTVTRSQRPTPVENLSILAGIQSTELRLKGTTLSLTRRALEPEHRLHSLITCPPGWNGWPLKLIHPFIPATQQLISSSDNNKRAVLWADHRWNAEWCRALRDSVLSSPTAAPTLLD